MHATPKAQREQILRRFPGIALATVSEIQNLAPMLETHRPEVVFSFKLERMTADALRPLMSDPFVKWIHNAGAGVDHFPEWDPGTVTVTNASGVLSDAMAEYVVASLLMMNIDFPRYQRQQAAREWRINSWQSVRGRTLLVIGLGNIGRRVAERAQRLGMHVIGVRSRPEPVAGVDVVVTAEHLLAEMARADFIAVHVPLIPRTRRLIDAPAIANMQPHAVLINTSRGGVVDEGALYEALRARRIKGAVMDVFNQEPLPANSPLWELDNMVITPHMADAVLDWEERMTDYFCDNLERWMARQPLENAVDPERGY